MGVAVSNAHDGGSGSGGEGRRNDHSLRNRTANGSRLC